MEVPSVVAGPRYVRLASAYLIALQVAGFCVGMLELVDILEFYSPYRLCVFVSLADHLNPLLIQAKISRSNGD